MHILFIHQVFLSPDEAGSTRHFELARYLVKKGNKVTIIASVVSYLTGKVEDRFKRKFLYKEVIEGIEVIRAWTLFKDSQKLYDKIYEFHLFYVLKHYWRTQGRED